MSNNNLDIFTGSANPELASEVSHILGIDIGSTIGLGLLGHTVDVLGRLAFTMPYLPREGEFIKAQDLI